MKRLIAILTILAATALSLPAQQMPQLTQRMIDETTYNPGCYGTKPYSQIFLHHRSQWIGFDNAPSTQVLSYDGKLNEEMALGGYVLNDITGPTRRFSLNAGYAYRFAFRDFMVSAGLALSLMQYGIDGNKITLHENSDLAITENVSEKAWRPDASFGGYMYNEKFYAGLSIMQLFGSKFRLNYPGDIEAQIKQVRHYYFTSGYNMEMGQITLQPSFLFGTTIASPSQLDFNIKATYIQKFTFGLGYRVNDALTILTGIKIKEQFFLAYSYDLVVGRLRTYNSGSHEIVLLFMIQPKEPAASVRTK